MSLLRNVEGVRWQEEEGTDVLQERMKTIHPDQIERKNFLGLERDDGIKTCEIYNRVENEVKRRLKIITKTKLNGKILMKVINTN